MGIVHWYQGKGCSVPCPVTSQAAAGVQPVKGPCRPLHEDLWTAVRNSYALSFLRLRLSTQWGLSSPFSLKALVMNDSCPRYTAQWELSHGMSWGPLCFPRPTNGNPHILKTLPNTTSSLSCCYSFQSLLSYCLVQSQLLRQFANSL